jgi:hypothetical protein
MDGMILTAALAAGLSLMRLCWPSTTRFSAHAVREWASGTAGAAMIPCTLAFVLIRLLTPRPRIDRLMCQPGMAACCAASVAITVALFSDLLGATSYQLSHPEHGRGITWFLHDFGYIYNIPVGPAVIAIWLALWISRRWRPERGWIDRLGRSIGVFWVAFMLTQWQFGRLTSSLANVLAGWVN